MSDYTDIAVSKAIEAGIWTALKYPELFEEVNDGKDLGL